MAAGLSLDPIMGDSDSEHKLPVKLPVMIPIPAGSFWMGTNDHQIKYLLSREDWADEWQSKDLFMVEQPQHQVNVNAFELALTPVTNGEYYVFVYNTNYKVPKNWIGFSFPEGMEEHPVTSISKIDAEAYIRWLSKETGSVYRLPTEAEWEKAARGSDQRIYPWGDNFDPWRCNTIESGKKQTTVIKNYSPGGDSPYKVTDMSGNVYEWTSTVTHPYPYKPENNIETKPGMKYIVRGGAWYYSRALARCSSRETVLADFISPALGFRIAKNSA